MNLQNVLKLGVKRAREVRRSGMAAAAVDGKKGKRTSRKRKKEKALEPLPLEDRAEKNREPNA